MLIYEINNMDSYIEKAKREILKYYDKDEKAFHILWEHSHAVLECCLRIIKSSDKKYDLRKVVLGALLHDIGIKYTNAPNLGCFGTRPYIEHGYLGHDLLLKNDELKDIAPFCERHTGVGIKKETIIKNKLPLPHKDLVPITIEEKLVCFADKFFSKSDKNIKEPKPFEEVKISIEKHGKENLERLCKLVELFKIDAVYKK
ncbi:MAG: HD domain-containing protein [Bacteroidales bacterium]